MWKTLDKLLKSEKKLPKGAKAREKTRARPLFTFQQPLPYHLNFSPQSMNTLWRIFMEKWDQSSAGGPDGRKKRNSPQPSQSRRFRRDGSPIGRAKGYDNPSIRQTLHSL